MEIRNYTREQKKFILNELREKYKMEILTNRRHKDKRLMSVEYRFKVPFTFKGFSFPLEVCVWEDFYDKSLRIFVVDYYSRYPITDLDSRDMAISLSRESGWDIVYCRTLAKKLCSEHWDKYLKMIEESENLFHRCFISFRSDSSMLSA